MKVGWSALLGLVAVAVGGCGGAPEPPVPPATSAREPAPLPPPTLGTPPQESSASPATAAAPQESEARPARTPAPPAKELPRYDVLGSTASPDGKSWCILSIRLATRVPEKTLRALWTALREEEATEWGRFTCRVHLPDEDLPWADVNEFMIFESPPPRAATAVLRDSEADLEIRIVEEGEDYVIYECEGVEIRIEKGR